MKKRWKITFCAVAVLLASGIIFHQNIKDIYLKKVVCVHENTLLESNGPCTFPDLNSKK